LGIFGKSGEVFGSCGWRCKIEYDRCDCEIQSRKAISAVLWNRAKRKGDVRLRNREVVGEESNE